MNIPQLLSDLRSLMRREHLGAFIFPSTDPHNGEYVPAHWEGRKWVSGFTGSAGTAVVTLDSAALWTDSRYFIAAAAELDDTEYVLMKEKMPGTPSVAQWLGEQLADSNYKEVGIDGMCVAASTAENLMAELRQNGGLTLRTNLDILAHIWTTRPDIPLLPVRVQPIEYSGVSAGEKLAMLRRKLRERHADGMLVAALDDIAWTLNIRGSDVSCNPVVVAYLLVSSDRATVFVNGCKISDEVRQYLNAEGVAIDEYENIAKGLADYGEYNILIDKDEINYTLYKKVRCNIVSAPSPIPALKAVKNAAEIRGFRNAMRRDGVALVKFTRWLKEGVAAHAAAGAAPDDVVVIDGEVQTELSIDRKLTALRAQQPLFRHTSFDTIAGYGPHAAIVHYEATEETDIPLRHHGFILIDSGAQYQDGTTDITRTIPLGPLTEEERRVYTLVLKGNINLAMLKFPDGASGTQLDAVARKDLWAYGYNYLHGTGHGIGSYLNVHEGPHQIRMEYRPAPLHAGMTVTDEPGIYIEGRFGVRIENTMIIRRYTTPLERHGITPSPTPVFLEFDPLTLCPIDTEPIILPLLSDEELEWLNAYHKTVCDTLAPLLDSDDRAWIEAACREVKR